MTEKVLRVFLWTQDHHYETPTIIKQPETRDKGNLRSVVFTIEILKMLRSTKYNILKGVKVFGYLDFHLG